MATYNRANFIVETLLSIQNQTYLNWECLIIDDGSTDGSTEIIKKFIESDYRFNYFQRNKIYTKGTSGSRNFGLDIANGDYIIFFDDDDIVHPQNLELCVYELAGSELSFCRYIRNVFYDKFEYELDYSKKYNSFYIDINDLEKVIMNNIPINSCSVMWKKECFIDARFNEEISYGDEWELYSRILSKGIKGISIEKCLFFGRKHSNSITSEYNSNDYIRRESYAKAILLVIKNLIEKDLLTNTLKIYFIKLSYNFKEFNLFNSIIKNYKLTKTECFKWKLYYFIFPVQFFFYRIKKSIFNS